MKHAVLARILVYLTQKDAPLRFIDTHAGAGRYDLAGAAARRSPEWRDGIARVLKAPAPAPIARLLAPYLQAVGAHDAGGMPASYPGSPAIAQALLRPLDRIALCEAHPEEREALVAALGRDSRLSIVGTDGYVALNAYCPPKERRGLVLIDPPFEEAGRVEARRSGAGAGDPQMADGNLRRLAADPRCGRRRALSQRGRRARRAEHPQARTRRRAGRSRRPRPGEAARAAAASSVPSTRRTRSLPKRARSRPGSPRCSPAMGGAGSHANGSRSRGSPSRRSSGAELAAGDDRSIVADFLRARFRRLLAEEIDRLAKRRRVHSE